MFLPEDNLNYEIFQKLYLRIQPFFKQGRRSWTLLHCIVLSFQIVQKKIEKTYCWIMLINHFVMSFEHWTELIFALFCRRYKITELILGQVNLYCIQTINTWKIRLAKIKLVTSGKLYVWFCGKLKEKIVSKIISYLKKEENLELINIVFKCLQFTLLHGLLYIWLRFKK